MALLKGLFNFMLVIVVLVAMFAVFFFGVLVGQGEFEDEQAKIRGIYEGIQSKINSITQLTKRETPQLLDQGSEEFRYKFYAEKNIEAQDAGKLRQNLYYLEITDPKAHLPAEIKGLLSGAQVKVELKATEDEGTKLKVGPFKTESEAHLAKEKIINQFKIKAVKIISESRS